MKLRKTLILCIMLMVSTLVCACESDINVNIITETNAAEETTAAPETIEDTTEFENEEDIIEESENIKFLFGSFPVIDDDSYTIKDYAKLYIENTVNEAIRIIRANPYEGRDVCTNFVGNTPVYQSLSEDCQIIYDSVYYKVKDFEYFYYSAEEYGYDFLDNLITVYGAICEDEPTMANYFFLNEVVEGDMTVGMESVYFYPYENEPVQADDIEQLKFDLDLFEAVSDYIINEMPPEFSVYDKYRYIAMVISMQTSYDYDCIGGIQDATAFGAICGGYSICQGYSNAFYYLCGKADLYCKRVSGSSRDVAHMWNIVEIEEGSYYVDVTWMDSDYYTPEDPEWYNYFMVTQEELLEDHVIDGDYVATGAPLPKPY